MSTSINKVFDNVPDRVGYLILNEDGSVEHSHDDLQNNEQAANLIYKMVLCRVKVSVHLIKQIAFKRFTVSDDQYVYCMACANHRIYVAKRRQESSTRLKKIDDN
ncbi:unnamed protein product [Rotaria socialis]|uniref:Late endosomal/lysosomal adaptor and MAPK and MTOR activator 4 n=1 Tax=Rotaria socialis TaxID=392032 RepID=A0A820CSJ9_9BILA|nr:unnamed protein product [Rotaria socialis]CAF3408814.1 unnamed protein product [Rotaria socialis]CAF3421945.1 unnamed protein product [Rotaria socialis]CAF3467027.1 unnamed protein product [Rotaria socialis]CAF3481538.1 unnamed protein product [Rotaria socialis]